MSPKVYFGLNSSCLDSCPIAGYYNNSGICAACSSTCFSCNNNLATQCTTCDNSTRIFYKGVCYLKGFCPTKTFEDGNNCTDCHTTCGECTGSLDSQCTSCLSSP